MIEIVYASNEKDNNNGNDLIRLPKNIKQVGDVKGSKKIYIEDYAVNFIGEAHLDDRGSAFGILLGRVQRSGADRYIFIRGAIKAPNVYISESEIMVSDSDWTDIYETIEKYFANEEIVGWFLSMDGINASAFRTIKKTHLELFASGEKTLFIYNRQEGEKYFCIYENEQLMRKKGYVIYYERNEQMQGYLIHRKETDRENTINDMIFYDETGINKSGSKEKKKLSGKTPQGRLQSFVNYCANVAMVLLVLFIGVYLVNSKNKSSDAASVNETQTTITSVIKVDGEVYPTKALQEETKTVNDNESMVEAGADTGAQITEVTDTDTQTGTGAAAGAQTAAGADTDAQTAAGVDAGSQTGDVVMENSSSAYITVNNNVGLTVSAEHTVKKGDSLYTISEQYYGDYSKVDAIMELNDIDNMDKIYIGQTLKLP